MIPTKKQFALAAIIKNSIFIHIDPRKHGVRVPEYLLLKENLILQIGYNMPVPIPDLKITDFGIYATLSFKGMPYECYVPWSAVSAIVSETGTGMQWGREETLTPALTQKSKLKRKANHLRLVK
jgi:stringent starvation protein B